MATINVWKRLAETHAADLKAKEQARIFVVEGPQTIVHSSAPAVVTVPHAKRSLLRRLTGG